MQMILTKNGQLPCVIFGNNFFHILSKCVSFTISKKVARQTQTRELKATLLGSDIHSSDFTSAQYLYSTPSDIWCRQMCSRRISGINRYRELQSEYRTGWWMAAEGNIQLIGISEVGVTWAGGHIGHWTWGTPRNWTWATPFPPHLIICLFVYVLDNRLFSFLRWLLFVYFIG